MLRDFFSFIRAFWAEWKTLLTGGSIIACVAIWNAVTGKNISHNASWFIVGLTLLLAAFSAWRKEWTAGSRGFVDVNLDALVEIASSRTSVHAQTLLRPYIGKSVKITGQLRNLKKAWPYAYISLDAGPKYRTSVYIPISRWKAQKLAPLHAGTLITVSGRIREVDRMSVELSGIMILGIEEPAKNSN